jgi:hypothetical protein
MALAFMACWIWPVTPGNEWAIGMPTRKDEPRRLGVYQRVQVRLVGMSLISGEDTRLRVVQIYR